MKNYAIQERTYFVVDDQPFDTLQEAKARSARIGLANLMESDGLRQDGDYPGETFLTFLIENATKVVTLLDDVMVSDLMRKKT